MCTVEYHVHCAKRLVECGKVHSGGSLVSIMRAAANRKTSIPGSSCGAGAQSENPVFVSVSGERYANKIMLMITTEGEKKKKSDDANCVDSHTKSASLDVSLAILTAFLVIVTTSQPIVTKE